MAKRYFEEGDRCCGNCYFHKTTFNKDGTIKEWKCENEDAEAFGFETDYGYGEECPDFQTKR